jgi:hypothetical protein
MPEPNCWYVSYAVKSDRDPRRYARVTRTFDSEEHAKLFVREIAADYLRLAAGTINPHSPKRVMSAAEIAAWLEAPVQFPVTSHAASQALPETSSSEAEQALQLRTTIQQPRTPVR